MYLRTLKQKVTFKGLFCAALLGFSATVNALVLPDYDQKEQIELINSLDPTVKAKACNQLVHEKHFSNSLPLSTDMSRREAGIAALGLAFGARNLTSPHPRHHTSLRAGKSQLIVKVSGSRNNDNRSRYNSAWIDYKRCINM